MIIGKTITTRFDHDDCFKPNLVLPMELKNIGGMYMSRHRSILSESLREELAREIGVHDIVKREGWGGVPSRQCGNLVAAAIKYAEKAFEQQNGLK